MLPPPPPVAAPAPAPRKPKVQAVAVGRAPLADEHLSDGGLISTLVRKSLAAAKPDGGAADIELRWATGALPPLRLLLSDATISLSWPWEGADCERPNDLVAGLRPPVRQRTLLGPHPTGGGGAFHAVQQQFPVRDGRKHFRQDSLHCVGSGRVYPQRRGPKLAVGEAGHRRAPPDAARLRECGAELRGGRLRRQRSRGPLRAPAPWTWRSSSRWPNARSARAASTPSR